MNLPRKRVREPMGLKPVGVLRVPQFLRFVRQHECSCFFGGLQMGRFRCEGAIEAAHVRTGTDGGCSLKPSDRFALPLCSTHHRRQHQIGERPFEKEMNISMRSIADGLWEQWLKTETGRRWKLKTGYGQ